MGENSLLPTKVIVTTDPGQDEAAAIMMMLAAPETFEVLGLVATNSTPACPSGTATRAATDGCPISRSFFARCGIP